eukprot:TRINITY_DN4398_c0_g1_i3.p1 TRINITY_DN4398_c0_g1~~TRINITY_DN4398_c0_g1_i3.p1  ORF type:complete len:494 (+),score=101.70 TRINITY_DN4398_c0_g1_i3:582-2063(+)
MHWAVTQGHLNVVSFLRKAGDDITTGDKRGYNALHIAVQSGQKPMLCHYLVQCGILVDAQDNDGHTALHWAAFKNNPDIAHYLVFQGADINKKDNDGCTPLHWACRKGSDLVTVLLMDEGALTSLKDKVGDDAKAAATRQKHIAVAKYIEMREKSNSAVLLTQWKRTVSLIGLCSPAIVIALFCQLPFWLATTLAVIYTHFARRVLRTQPEHILEKTLFPDCWFGSAVVLTELLYFVGIWPHRGFRTADALLIISCVTLVVQYYFMLNSDPGILKKNTATPEVIEEWASSNQPLGDFCETCCCVRPLRSKHNPSAHGCVARFDHFCMWTHCPIGFGNQQQFFVITTNMLLSSLLAIYVAISYLRDTLGCGLLCPLSPHGVHAAVSLHAPATCLVVFHLCHLYFACPVLWDQLRSACTNLTTTERLSEEQCSRYLHTDARTGRLRCAFDRGLLKNVIEFALHTVDYYHFYNTDLPQLPNVEQTPVAGTEALVAV